MVVSEFNCIDLISGNNNWAKYVLYPDSPIIKIGSSSWASNIWNNSLYKEGKWK